MEKENGNMKATQEHCKFCFQVIASSLNNQPAPTFPQQLPIFKSPLFVTWNIDEEELRGCIGTFQHESIDKVLPQYAMISAFKDSRFSPISIKELPRLSVSVSLLVNFQEGKKALDWEVGKHGIVIEFTHNGFSGRGTYLPEVAQEQEWDQLTTIAHLVHKAGYRGKDLEDVIPKIKLTTYESSKATLSYREFLKFNSTNNP